MQSDGSALLQVEIIDLPRVFIGTLVAAAKRGDQPAAANDPLLHRLALVTGQLGVVREDQELESRQPGLGNIKVIDQLVRDAVRLENVFPTAEITLILLGAEVKAAGAASRIVPREEIPRVCRIQQGDLNISRENRGGGARRKNHKANQFHLPSSELTSSELKKQTHSPARLSVSGYFIQEIQ